MNNYQFKTPIKEAYENGENGYKVVEVNISDFTENVYAVVTPINRW